MCLCIILVFYDSNYVMFNILIERNLLSKCVLDYKVLLGIYREVDIVIYI